MRMHDSITAAHIPADATAVAGYIDGWYKWRPEDWALFPHAFKLRIAISATTNDGDVLDIERGDATPEQAPGWVAMRRAAGLVRPVLYCDRTTLPAVHYYMTQAGQEADYWVADYTGGPHHIAGAIAVQWSGDSTSGGHYDLSDIEETWINALPADHSGKVAPMFNPPIGPFVAVRAWVDGGYYAVGPDGAMYAFDCPPVNGANGKTYFSGRTAADFVHGADGKIMRNPLGGPTIVATSGETYALAPR